MHRIFIVYIYSVQIGVKILNTILINLKKLNRFKIHKAKPNQNKDRKEF